MRHLALIASLIVLAGCGPGLEFNRSEMTLNEMMRRASLVFVGVIESHHVDSWPFFRVKDPDGDRESARQWKVLRRRVRVELVIRGSYSREWIDVQEIHWFGGKSGNWNFTQDGERALFMVRQENGLYHVVRDWWRSIFPVTSGPHRRLPLDDSHPVWERIALMNLWLPNDPNFQLTYPHLQQTDPARALDRWRTAKLLRGLLRHPSRDVRVKACWGLVFSGLDDVQDTLSADEQRAVAEMVGFAYSRDSVAERRKYLRKLGAHRLWRVNTEREDRRFLTTVIDPAVRREACRLYMRTYPGDTDIGCPRMARFRRRLSPGRGTFRSSERGLRAGESAGPRR